MLKKKLNLILHVEEENCKSACEKQSPKIAKTNNLLMNKHQKKCTEFTKATTTKKSTEMKNPNLKGLQLATFPQATHGARLHFILSQYAYYTPTTPHQSPRRKCVR